MRSLHLVELLVLQQERRRRRQTRRTSLSLLFSLPQPRSQAFAKLQSSLTSYSANWQSDRNRVFRVVWTPDPSGHARPEGSGVQTIFWAHHRVQYAIALSFRLGQGSCALRGRLGIRAPPLAEVQRYSASNSVHWWCVRNTQQSISIRNCYISISYLEYMWRAPPVITNLLRRKLIWQQTFVPFNCACARRLSMDFELTRD